VIETECRLAIAVILSAGAERCQTSDFVRDSETQAVSHSTNA
jgi:hypothetical protein